jgi:hypothetical protein
VLDIGCGDGENTMKYVAKIKTKNIIVEEVACEAQSMDIHAYIANLIKSHACALVATENLAIWPNILSLLFGYQPFLTTNISRYSLGNSLIWHLDEQKNTHFFEKHKDVSGEGLWVTRRVLAYKTFKDIFSLECFKVEEFLYLGGLLNYFPV